MGQGQPRVIIWTTLIVLPYTMLHTMFQDHWSIGSREEEFLRFLPYMGMVAILVMWPRPFEQFFVPLTPGGYIWNLVTIGPVVSEEKSFEIIDGWRTEPAYTISSPGAFGLGELKKKTRQSQKVMTAPTICNCGLGLGPSMLKQEFVQDIVVILIFMWSYIKISSQKSTTSITKFFLKQHLWPRPWAEMHTYPRYCHTWYFYEVISKSVHKKGTKTMTNFVF